jgi:hypothetical protein
MEDNNESSNRNPLAKAALIIAGISALFAGCSWYQMGQSNEISEQSLDAASTSNEISEQSLDAAATSNAISEQSLDVAATSNAISEQSLYATTINVETDGYFFVAESPKFTSSSDQYFFARKGTDPPLVISSELFKEITEETEEDADNRYAYVIFENKGPGLMKELELTEALCTPAETEELDGWNKFPPKIGYLESSQGRALLVYIWKESEPSVIYESLPCSKITVLFNYIDVNNEPQEGSEEINLRISVELESP